MTLLRPRHIRVLVLREDARQAQVSLQTSSLRGLGTTQTTIGGGRQAEGQILELPAYENDVLNALAKTGGLPGLESTQEVVIQRGFWDTQLDPTCQNPSYPTQADTQAGNAQRRVVRIPLQTKPHEPLNSAQRTSSSTTVTSLSFADAIRNSSTRVAFCPVVKFRFQTTMI